MLYIVILSAEPHKNAIILSKLSEKIYYCDLGWATILFLKIILYSGFDTWLEWSLKFKMATGERTWNCGYWKGRQKNQGTTRSNEQHASDFYILYFLIQQLFCCKWSYYNILYALLFRIACFYYNINYEIHWRIYLETSQKNTLQQKPCETIHLWLLMRWVQRSMAIKLFYDSY